MANLITERQKKAIRTDYFIRYYSVCLLILSLLGLFFLAYVIPYYVSVSHKDLRVAEQFKSVINVENKENIGESASQVVSQTLDEMKVIELYGKDGLIPSAYLSRVIASKNYNIRITRLSFSPAKGGQGQLLVSGVSKSREGLVAFIDDLKSKGGFGSVESPVSDFAKDSDISFSLNIKTAI